MNDMTSLLAQQVQYCVISELLEGTEGESLSGRIG